MGKTRLYEFDTGIETSTRPDPSTPTNDNDQIYKGYADGQYARLEEWGIDVANNAALKAVSTADRSNGQVRLVQSTEVLYYFNSSSSAADDGDTVLAPDSGSGRWIKITGSGSAGSAGGGNVLTIPDDPKKAVIIAGCQDNTAKFWQKKFHVLSNWTQGAKNIDLQEEFGEVDHEVRSTLPVANDTSSAYYSSSATDYLGASLNLAKSSVRTFKSKIGENFFGIAFREQTTGVCDAVTILVDGVAVNTYGCVDETGAAVSATFSTVAAAAGSNAIKYFFNLDPNKEQTISVENTDSGTDPFLWTYIVVGYRTPENAVAVDEKIHLYAGRALVRNVDVAISDQDLTFDAGAGYGRTDMLKVDTQGNLSIVKGVEPAMTQARSGTTVSDEESTMELKSTFYFPSKGFALVSSPWGAHRVVSYTGKSETTINAHQLTGVLWESGFGDDIAVQQNFGGSTGTFVGDVNVNLLADNTNSIEVSSSNNRLDFTIAEDGGSASAYAATITSGLYSANLMSIGTAITEAMEAAHSLPENGEYFCEYNEIAGKWTIGVRGLSNVDSFDLDFSTGPNQANSIHSDLGFSDTDFSGAFSYLAENEKMHKAVLAFERGEFQDAADPIVMQRYADSGSGQTNGQLKAEFEQGLYGMVVQNESGSEMPFWKILPDPDSVGLEMYFLRSTNGAAIEMFIDFGHAIYPLQTDMSESVTSTSDTGTQLLKCIVTFPRGSKNITFWPYGGTGEIVGGDNRDAFVGFRQLKTKPAIETLSIDEAMLRAYDIAPLQLYKEYYADDYVVQSNAFERIDSITYNGGGWSSGADNDQFNGRNRETSTTNEYVDVTFTLVGDGGGIAMQAGEMDGSNSANCCLYLTEGATGTNSSANKMTEASQNNHSSENNYEYEIPSQLGLSAGQYTARFRHEGGANAMQTTAFVIYDTVPSDMNADVIANVQNDDRSLSIPWNVEYHNCQAYGFDRVPSTLQLTGYREGEVYWDFKDNNNQFFAHNEGSNMRLINAKWHTYYSFGAIGEGPGFHAIARAMVFRTLQFTTYMNNTALNIDGVATSNFWNTIQDVKAGTSASSTRNPIMVSALKNFERFLDSDMSSSTVCPVSDTTGMRAGQRVKVTADGETTQYRTIASVTTNTSVTLNTGISAYANFTTANNAKVYFYGFHRFDYKNSAAVNLSLESFGFVPMPVVESKSGNKKDINGEVAVTYQYNLSNGDDIAPPVYSDGSIAKWYECSVDIQRISGTAISWTFNGFKNLSLSGGNIDVKITAVKGRRK